MFLLNWLRDLVRFSDFQDDPFVASETPNNARYGNETLDTTNYGAPYWDIPTALICAMPLKDRWFYERYPRLLGQADFDHVANRLWLVLDMLEFADEHLGQCFGVRAVYHQFAGRISLHDVMQLARSLEVAKLLERQRQRNRPRRLNMANYDIFWEIATDWLESKPGYTLGDEDPG